MNEPGTLDACYAKFSIFSAQVLMTLKNPHVLKTIKVLYISISFLSPSLVVVPLITLWLALPCHRLELIIRY